MISHVFVLVTHKYCRPVLRNGLPYMWVYTVHSRPVRPPKRWLLLSADAIITNV